MRFGWFIMFSKFIIGVGGQLGRVASSAVDYVIKLGSLLSKQAGLKMAI
jgi:hypothetical protein